MSLAALLARRGDAQVLQMTPVMSQLDGVLALCPTATTSMVDGTLVVDTRPAPYELVASCKTSA